MDTYCLKINILEDFIEAANHKLFRNLQNHQHCLHSLLPPTKRPNHDLRPKGHNYTITPQNSRNDLPFLIRYSNITNFCSFLCLCFCAFLLLLLS